MWDQVSPRWWCCLDDDSSPHVKWARQNFGDEPLNHFLLSRLFPKLKFDVKHPKFILLGIGSILGMRINCMREKETKLPLLVYGSGYQYGEINSLPSGSRIFCVRGKLTAKAFDIDERLACADPAILLPDFLPRNIDSIPGNTARIYRWSYGLQGKDFPINMKMKLIDYYRKISDPRFSQILTSRAPEGVEEWIKHLWSFERIETDSLHAAIVADAYGILWKPLTRTWHFKWDDHFAMLGIPKKPDGYVLSDRNLLEERRASLLKQRDNLIQFIEFTKQPPAKAGGFE